MRKTRSILSLVELTGQVRSYPELEDLLGEAVSLLGFDYFAVTHYVTDPLAAKVVNITNFPERWIRAVAEDNHNEHNPIKAAVRNSLLGFSWSEIQTRIALTPRQAQTLRAAEANGVVEGFTVPAHLVDDVSGSISFAMKPGGAIERRHLPAAHFFACAAYETSLRLSKALEFPAHSATQLTERQLDCVVLIARGKSDWEIGKLLEISQETVHKHIQAAMRRLHVVTRTQLVVRALYDEQMSFSDIFN